MLPEKMNYFLRPTEHIIWYKFNLPCDNLTIAIQLKPIKKNPEHGVCAWSKNLYTQTAVQF